MNQVYLNSIEEVIKALKNGERVYNGSSVEGKPMYYMQDGVIISEYKDGNKFINSGSIEFKENKLYRVEKEPIKIEVGKFYKTREGKKCICMYDDGNEYEFRVLNEKDSFWVDFNGASNHNDMQDILDYWED